MTEPFLIVFVLSALLPLLLAAAFLLGRHLQRRQIHAPRLSMVSRQHIDLWQGGSLNEDAVEAAKSRFRELLERGEDATVEASLRPGTQYVFQVRALAEIGTESAGRILERQLSRRLSDDQLEQSWYWIDLANSLRLINRQESLPHLLRCAERTGENPLGHFFAAETVCFLGFASYLQHGQSGLGRSAVRLLHRALEGLRFGLPPQVVTDARLGEAIETLWDHRKGPGDPWIARVAHETVRYLRRVPHAERLLRDERNESETFQWQMSRLSALEPALLEYLAQAPRHLITRLELGSKDERHVLLQALNELRADAGLELMRLVRQPDFGPVELGVEVLTWSRSAQVGPWLREWIRTAIPQETRSHWRRRHEPPRNSRVPRNFPYRALLRALRGHPSVETERCLLLAAHDWDPTYRAAAYSSLGWWEPLERAEVLACLEEGRRDPSPEVRQSARAALARLGERHALHWFRQALTAEDAENIHEAMQVIAAENLFFLWPDLDRLADSDNFDVATHAREALERLSEEMDWSKR